MSMPPARTFAPPRQAGRGLVKLRSPARNEPLLHPGKRGGGLGWCRFMHIDLAGSAHETQFHHPRNDSLPPGVEICHGFVWASDLAKMPPPPERDRLVEFLLRQPAAVVYTIAVIMSTRCRSRITWNRGWSTSRRWRWVWMGCWRNEVAMTNRKGFYSADVRAFKR